MTEQTFPSELDDCEAVDKISNVMSNTDTAIPDDLKFFYEETKRIIRETGRSGEWLI